MRKMPRDKKVGMQAPAIITLLHNRAKYLYFTVALYTDHTVDIGKMPPYSHYTVPTLMIKVQLE
jgi:hypothetical protein